MDSKPYYDALPSALVPQHYDLSVYDIDVKNNTFKGTVSIHLDVKDPTDEVHLNYRFLDVNEAGVSVSNGIRCVGVQMIKEKETFIVKFDKIIDPSDTSSIIVTIKYDAFIQTNMTGFYRSDYVENGEDNVMLCTQFECPDARRTFPCLDEPNLKATYTIEVTIPGNWTALANMPVETETLDNDNQLKTVLFEKTPKVSSYLVAWACGDFEYVESFTQDLYYDDKPLPIRVYTTPGYSDKAEYALSIAPKIIDYFSRVFDLKYPLPKLDLIAVHSFSHNAMENWGLVTYRANALLYDAKTSDPSFKKQVCYVVAHELAHMWFGDLVTMKWWDELWLNEGFATWVGYTAVDHIHPEWNIFDMVAVESLQESLTLDALRSSHPIHVPVIDAVDVDQIFDAISYLKGCSIISMLSKYIGQDTFLKGVADYLNRNKFGNGTTSDLWESVGNISGKPVSQMMEAWVSKIGFPLIDIETHGSQLMLCQSRFLSTGDTKPEEDDTIWWVPLNISLGKASGDVLVTSVDSFTSKKVVLEDVDVNSFFKVNKDSTGFYRVNYSPEILETIILPNFDKFTAKDKIGLLADIAAISISGCKKQTNTTTLLKVFKAIIDSDELGDDYSVWLEVNEITKRLKIVFSGDEEIIEGITKFITFVYKSLGQKLLKEVKADGIEDEDFGKVKLISALFNANGVLHVPEFVEYAKELFGKWKETGDIHASLKFFVFSTIASLPDLSSEDFDTLVHEITDPSTLDSREHAVKALPCISNLDYLPRILDMLKDTSIVPLMDSHYMAQGLATNVKTRGPFWDYFKENYESFYGVLSSNIPILERFVRFSFVNYQSEEMAKDLEAFYSTRSIVGFERSYGQAVDTVKANSKWYARDVEIVKQWLNNQDFI